MMMRKPVGMWVPALMAVMAVVAGMLAWTRPTIGQTDNEPAQQAAISPRWTERSRSSRRI